MSVNTDLIRARCAEIEESVTGIEKFQTSLIEQSETRTPHTLLSLVLIRES
jgi:hypothetical protein